MKTCSKCKEEKTLEEFSKDANRKDGRGSQCSVCKNKLRKVWRENNKAHTKNYMRNYLLETNYGITNEQYMQMMMDQDFRCKTCNQSQDFHDKNFAVDHDHSCCPGEKTCGKCLRGLLCQPCNVALGLINDDLVVLRRMIEYLEA